MRPGGERNGSDAGQWLRPSPAARGSRVCLVTGGSGATRGPKWPARTAPSLIAGSFVSPRLATMSGVGAVPLAALDMTFCIGSGRAPGARAGESRPAAFGQCPCTISRAARRAVECRTLWQAAGYRRKRRSGRPHVRGSPQASRVWGRPAADEVDAGTPRRRRGAQPPSGIRRPASPPGRMPTKAGRTNRSAERAQCTCSCVVSTATIATPTIISANCTFHSPRCRECLCRSGTRSASAT